MANGTRSPTQEAVVRYIRRGFSPIHVPGGSKKPNRLGWQNERYTLEDVPRVWNNGQNIGLLTGEPSGGLVDVDLDVPEAVRIAATFLPPTITSGRASAPRSHWWYMAPGVHSETFRDTNGTVLVELRANGRQTIVPPSTHPSGERVVWQATPGTASVSAITAEDLTHRVRELATAVLIARAVPPVGGRHDYALALAGFLLRRNRLDQDTVLKIMLAAWRAADADTREAVRDLEGIVRDTSEKLSAGEPVVGGPSLEEVAPGVVRLLCRWWKWDRGRDAGGATDAGREPSDDADRAFTAAELLAEELPPVRWIVPDILPEGVTILGGKPKMGKSWLAYGLCVAVASGGVALGTKPVERGECLYLALEDNKRRLQKRLRKLLAGETPPEGLHIRLSWPRLDEGGAEALGDWLAEHPDARLVVVDTLKKVRPRTNASGTSRSVYDLDYEALESLLPVAAQHGVSILVVHHLRKMDADDPLDAISGSTGLTGGVDGTLVLKRERGRADAFLHVDGRDVEDPAEFALTWNPNVGSWTLAGSAEEFRVSQERRAVLDLLENAAEPMSPKDIADALGKTGANVRMLLTKMVRDDQAQTAGYGKYASGCTDYTDCTPDRKAENAGASATGTRSSDCTSASDASQSATAVLRDDCTLETENGIGTRSVNGATAATAEPQSDAYDRPDVSETVRRLFANPPGWLKTQAEIAREKGYPERLVKPLAAAVAAHLANAGIPATPDEVRPAVETRLNAKEV